MTRPTERTNEYARITPAEVAENQALRDAARVLANLYLFADDVTALLEGSDFTPHAEREFIADLIDADHILDFNDRWVELLAGAPPRGNDEGEPWLIDRPWRGKPEPWRSEKVTGRQRHLVDSRYARR